MFKLILTLMLIVISSTVIADDDFLEFGSKEFKSEQYQKSAWNFSIGYGYLEWNRVMPEFEGSFDSIEDEETAYLSGLLLDFGREFYLGSSFSVNIKAGVGYYVSLEEITQQAHKDLDLDLAELDSSHELYTGELSLALGYLIDTKYVGIQPFIEGAFGAGMSRVDRHYEYDGLPGSADVPNPEKYKVIAEESFLYTKASLGLTIIGWKGITSHLKLTAMVISKSEREFRGRSETQAGSEISRSSKDDDLDETETIVTGSLGFGFIF